MFTLFMLVTFEVTLVTQRLNQMRELRSLQTPKQHIQVYRCGQCLFSFLSSKQPEGLL